MSELPIVDTRYTQERELSWLRFNERVLDEARDESVPLFERLKFAARWITQDAVSAISEVRYRLSVRG